MKPDKKNKYWGEISSAQMNSLNDLSEKIGWQNAVSQALNKDLKPTLLDEHRTDWKYLTGQGPKSKVLDIGAGFGANAISLAKSSETVYALEPVWERIRFLNIRVKQDNIKNIKPVCGNVFNIPFPDGFFDLAVLNGVLEWVGYFADGVKPNVAQEQALKEISRVLKPSGVIYIGIENRFAFINFLGVKDAHTGLPFINLMPRFVANLYHTAVKKQRYSAYLYSYGGYINLLKKAGFKKTSFYTPLPSYRNFSYIFPLNNIDIAMKFWLSKLLYSRISGYNQGMRMVLTTVKLILNTPLKYLIKYFTLDFCICASKEKLPSDIFQDYLLQGGKPTENKRKPDLYHAFYCSGWRKKLLFYFRNRQVNPGHVWMVADRVISEQRLRNTVNIISQMAHLGGHISDKIPEILYAGYLNNEYCSLQSAKSGAPLVKYLLKYKNDAARIEEIISRIRDFLIALTVKTGILRITQDNTILKDIAYKNLAAFTRTILLEEEEYQRVCKFIEGNIEYGKINSVLFAFQHGDLQPNNILYERDDKFTIIDWEYGSQEGLPAIDLLFFLFVSAVFIADHSDKYKQKFAHSLFSYSALTDTITPEIFDYCFYQKNKISDLIKRHLGVYCEALNISLELRRFLFLIFIFQNANYKKDFLLTFLQKGNPVNL